ncbi:hypothetical protein VOLCADRAFT_121617 [Volvox carteri f. nagariensis]|uniref:PhoD-like phosphatase domain-containing protein n=1 Tax=Volvox carteri f. nagariensis TaxID=3068 RepID=D8UEX1_VOLCA|nr:uncharacterized protein VOLCADRAFT_121617 [Volvox carteri f. nagariensis]EFJ41758.1 hypothetical protein VOLCADRAFT_121617 [Volvox carteri f. nagariensis]|eukprot:XP_002957260.1 hypothetical protein VOLCADRAFT_121617 [Volvox carteri f. nagariensis]
MQSQLALPTPQQAAAGPVTALTAPPEHQQLQHQQTVPAGAAASPMKGLMRIFARKQPSDANVTSPPQQQQPGVISPTLQPANSATSPPAGAGQASPERQSILGIFGSRGSATLEQQQLQQQQVNEAQQALESLQLVQGASAQPQRPGIYPPVPESSVGQAPPQLGGGMVGGLPGGVPVIPPPGGLCSRLPPPADEVARLQSSPLGPSKFGSLNTVPSSSSRGRSASSPGAAAKAPAVDPQFSGPAPLEDKYGPYLRYGGYDPVTRIYSASVMMVIHQSRSRYPPTLKYRDTRRQGSSEEIRNPLLLWSYAGYNFWRWDMAFQLGNDPTVVEYFEVCSEDHWFTPHPRNCFHLPSASQKWHWGFYSCNGFHDHNDELLNGGIQPMWRDVMHVHTRDPLHVMFGGGDQLYCDDVWKVDSLVKWLSIQDKPSRNAHPFSQDMVNEVFDFYFRNYTTHFGKEVFRDALASIPQVMTWDDHDIFDGWGSYPPELQKCSVFAGVYFVARKFYLLFQCHAAENNYRELNKGWGLTGLSWTMMLGNTTAVVGLDSRGERTREQIIRPASWAAFADQVVKLPAGVRHVVAVATVPLVYPTVPGIEEAMMALAGTGLMVSALTAFLQKTGLSSQIYSHFGEPELLDDLLDHWSARSHEMEKYCFVRMMQDLAKARGFRFSILSGDVHCAGVAAFQTMPKINLKTDHRHMVQIISSAIGNVPPPDAVIKTLTASNKSKMLDAMTREKMRGIFENNSLLKASRNWCDIHERPLLQGAAATTAAMAGGVSRGPPDGSLWFQLRVEHPLYKEKFQEELVAAGVGLDAALPVEAGSVPYPPQGSVPQNSSQQEFGLQSDIDQQQQQQQQQQLRGLPLVHPPQPAGGPTAVPAPGSYPAIPPVGTAMVTSGGLHASPPVSGPSPLLPSGQVTQEAPNPQSLAEPPPATYSGVATAMLPQGATPGRPGATPNPMYAPMTGPASIPYASQPQPQQPSNPPHMQQLHPQQGQMPYQMHYQPQQLGAAAALPYPAYQLQASAPPYPHSGNPSYTGGGPSY